MARTIFTIDIVAKKISEAVELVEIIISNDDNVGYGEIINVDDGSEYGTKALTDHGIENLQELLADIRTWEGGIHQFLIDEQCEPDVIKRIMATEKSN